MIKLTFALMTVLVLPMGILAQDVPTIGQAAKPITAQQVLASPCDPKSNDTLFDGRGNEAVIYSCNKNKQWELDVTLSSQLFFRSDDHQTCDSTDKPLVNDLGVYTCGADGYLTKLRQPTQAEIDEQAKEEKLAQEAKAAHEKKLKDLSWALRTRALNSKEQAEVASLADELTQQENFNGLYDKYRAFNDDLLQQFRLRQAASRDQSGTITVWPSGCGSVPNYIPTTPYYEWHDFNSFGHQ